MSAADPLVLDVFADVACPWCFIGRRRLRRALAEAGPVTVRHRSYQLHPELPPAGAPMAAFAAARWGSPERARRALAAVEREGAAEGIAFAFEAAAKAPNTLLAHRAIALAREQGFEEAALDALFRAHLAEGRDITDAGVVVARLAAAGVRDPAALEAGLATGGGLPAVAADLALAQAWEVAAVPLFVADGRVSLTGAQPPALLAALIAHARTRRTGT